MGALIEKLFGGPGPLIQLDTANACSSQCCDETVSESSESVKSPHTVLTHESWHEPTADRVWRTDPPESSIPNGAKTNKNKCESGSYAPELEVSGDHGSGEIMKF